MDRNESNHRLAEVPRFDSQARSRSCAERHRARPWLVVAGTAHTAVGKTADFHNRARVFDGHGDEVLSYNKLHPYQMSTREATRYSLHNALGSDVPRTEDIIASPRRFAIIEAPIGRVGVVICEDLSNDRFITSLIDGLDIDWLFVPVMDGCQTFERWTARYARDYAGRNVSVVVATTMSLFAAHLADYDRRT